MKISSKQELNLSKLIGNLSARLLLTGPYSGLAVLTLRGAHMEEDNVMRVLAPVIASEMPGYMMDI